MSNLKPPLTWQVGFVLGIGVLAVSTAAILIRLALEANHSTPINRVGFSLVLAASRLAIAIFGTGKR